VTFVVAAGNWYSDACNYSPSSEASAITVGAIDSTDTAAAFSNSGSCVDIMAPGVHIISAAITSPTATSSKSGTSMASPHVAGVVANMLGNAPTMTPTQVATQLIANATDATLTNLPSGTTNDLLYQQPASANSFSLSAEVDISAVVSDSTADDSSVVVYEEDPGIPQQTAVSVPPKAIDPVTPSPVVTAPVETVVTPPAPSTSTSSQMSSVASAPQPSSVMTKISIGKITKVGKQLRVAVNAPKGSKVSLYRNGKLVGKGVKKFFMVPISKVTKQSFTAVISVAGAFVSSASVSLR
jgi:subtilisin family serine protease